MPQPETLLEGKYEILSKIREGGMGTIYLVRHRLLDRIRVIKVMREHVSADPDLKRRFIEEAKTATRLSHPNICTIHDFAVDEEATAYLVMEFIEGVNVSELLGMKGPPGVALSLEIAHQTLLALGYLHRKHVIHRDVAPDNLMLTKTEEGSPLVKVIDLGIAKAADRPTEMTASGVFLGKLRYASPEQAGALGPGERLDGRSDLYSMGVILYELLTGVRPFAGESPAEMLRGHLFQPPLPFSESDPKGVVPPELRAVVLKALEKKRDDRYTSGGRVRPRGSRPPATAPPRRRSRNDARAARDDPDDPAELSRAGHAERTRPAGRAVRRAHHAATLRAAHDDRTHGVRHVAREEGSDGRSPSSPRAFLDPGHRGRCGHRDRRAANATAHTGWGDERPRRGPARSSPKRSLLGPRCGADPCASLARAESRSDGAACPDPAAARCRTGHCADPATRGGSRPAHGGAAGRHRRRLAPADGRGRQPEAHARDRPL